MYNLICAPSEDSDQPARPRSLIRVFAECSMGESMSKPYYYQTRLSCLSHLCREVDHWYLDCAGLGDTLTV